MVDACMETSMRIEDMAYSCSELSGHLRHMLWARYSPEMQKNLQAICLESHCPSTSSRATSLGGSGGLQTYLQTTPHAASSTPFCNTGKSVICFSWGSQSMQKRSVLEDDKRLQR